MKNIKCPHCQSLCEIGIGYYCDEKINIRCVKCNQVILATNEDDEKPLIKLYTKPVKETSETQQTQQTQQHYQSYPYAAGRHQSAANNTGDHTKAFHNGYAFHDDD